MCSRRPYRKVSDDEFHASDRLSSSSHHHIIVGDDPGQLSVHDSQISVGDLQVECSRRPCNTETFEMQFGDVHRPRRLSTPPTPSPPSPPSTGICGRPFMGPRPRTPLDPGSRQKMRTPSFVPHIADQKPRQRQGWMDPVFWSPGCMSHTGESSHAVGASVTIRATVPCILLHCFMEGKG